MSDGEVLHYLLCGATCLLVAAIVDALAFWVDSRCHRHGRLLRVLR